MLVSFLKQPSVIAYIITGLVVGSLGYAHASESHVLDSLGQIGICLLLFMVGLELDLKRIKQLGKVAILTGFGQIIFTALAGYGVIRLLGFNNISAWYIAIALTFSSTIIVVKLLAEKKDLQSLYARIVVSFLIVQDFVALFILLFLGGSGGGQDVFRQLPTWQYGLAMAVKVLILVLLLMALSKKVFPKFLNRFGKSDELLMIFSLAWALGLAAFMSMPAVGFSLEVGGFIAGLALANSHVHFEISAKVKSLRDFFIIIFFIVFGTKLVLGGIVPMLPLAAALSLFVLVGNPIIMMFIMGLLGYTPRTSFFAAVTTAQVSEFSFVLIALGSRLGHISEQVLSLVTLVGVITIAGSSYLILYSRQIYEYLEKPLSWFNFKNGSAEKRLKETALKDHIIVAGANRLGSRFIHHLPKEYAVVVVDFDPYVVKNFENKGIPAVCGDATDPDIQDQAYLENAKLIISTIPDFDDNLVLLAALKLRTEGKRKKPHLIFVAQNDFESKYLYEQGVDYVLSPHFVGGVHLARLLEEKDLKKSLKRLKEGHLEALY